MYSSREEQIVPVEGRMIWTRQDFECDFQESWESLACEDMLSKGIFAILVLNRCCEDVVEPCSGFRVEGPNKAMLINSANVCLVDMVQSTFNDVSQKGVCVDCALTKLFVFS